MYVFSPDDRSRGDRATSEDHAERAAVRSQVRGVFLGAFPGLSAFWRFGVLGFGACDDQLQLHSDFTVAVSGLRGNDSDALDMMGSVCFCRCLFPLCVCVSVFVECLVLGPWRVMINSSSTVTSPSQ